MPPSATACRCHSAGGRPVITIQCGASSLAFTPVQGIELVNPSQKQDSKEGTETYFSKQAAFFAGS